jgi:cyclic beta-1,2-glucan synthetase
VTPANTAAPSDHAGKVVALEAKAVALAASQRDLTRSVASFTLFLDSSPITRSLEAAQKRLVSSADARSRKAAEWFLDNYYLIRRVARQVVEELPRGFVRHLPQLASDPGKGLLRIDALAQGLVASTQLELDLAGIRRFIEAYQQISPLTIAELWALPTLLRTCVLNQLLRSLAELDVPVSKVLDGNLLHAEGAGLEPDTGVQRAIHALRVLDAIDWKIFFGKTNRVEAILRTDPATVYERMDFETRDAYRKVVEALAWSTGKAEQDVATLAIALAREHGTDERRAHVGYYLVDDGRRVLEAQIGLRARGLERARRSLTARPMLWYSAALGVLTGVPLLALGWALMLPRVRPVAIAGALLIAAVPLSTAAASILQWLLAVLLRPRTQPKLDFTNGVPDDARTLVVIPTLLGNQQDIDGVIRQLELHYLCNPDPVLQFALLTDDVDAMSMPQDQELVESVSSRIAALNARHGEDGVGPFHLLHREPRWNPGEQRFMGWERKRGKLEELNRLLRGDAHTSYSRHVGAAAGLQDIRFVITLDSDTQLPMGSARRLIGVLAHPLNRAVFDPETKRVVAGYTIVQPRVEPSPSSIRNTRFARMFSGDIGFDIYTHAVSELYQDLFGAGIYVGKGIYEVDAFMRSLAGRVPDNTLVSHDLFEGVHGRTALATDIVLFEDYPSSYATYAKRMHRWIRGDWQLLPWLLPTVPSGDGGRLRNRLARVDRWKILDNLRRSLVSPALCLLLILGWTCLPGDPALWTLGSLALLFAPLVQSLLFDHRRLTTAGRGLFALVFLAFEGWLAIDAVARAVVRMAVTHRHLLQWTTAAQAEHGLRSSSQRAVYWRTMLASPLIAVTSGLLIAVLRPAALPIALPVLVLWCMAPEIARWMSLRLRPRVEALRPDERRRLRLLARRTWSFFDTFVGPNDQWLPIDNYQEPPHEQTAHRTSPTNIGLMLLSTMSAHDLGYVGPLELSLRLRRAFDSIARLMHYRGHLLNWYDTTNLQPLLPRYVSTVDSGNFAGCLVALKQGLREIANGPVLRVASWDGLLDSLDLLAEVVESVHASKAGSKHDVPALLAVIKSMRREIVVGRERPEHAYAALQHMSDDTILALDRELLEFFAVGSRHYDVTVLHELRSAIETFHQLLQQMRRSLDTLMPWLSMMDEAAARELDLPAQIGLHEIEPTSAQLCERLDRWEGRLRDEGILTAALEASAGRVRNALRRASTGATALRTELLALAAVADEEARGMDFKLLFNAERKIFHIGYNATADELDPHFYDLLASEARLASYIAIVKGDAPQAHWYALGRPMTNVDGSPTLLSWGGTMFEYLMPGLLMRSQEGTLLAQTCELAVAAQIANARDVQEPWGISESAYARVDAQDTYQYRSFGVPGLGFRRGLEEDRVITPYASMLAVATAPRAVFDNVGRLEAMGMMGAYGLYEALDFAPERAPAGRLYSVVRSYMAHHQGMLLVALGNELSERSMVDRFHSDAVIATGEILLNEHAPSRAPAEWPLVKAEEGLAALPAVVAPHAPGPWSPAPQAAQAFVLSNGRLTSLLTASGGGGLTWQGIALTRYQPDATRDDDGLWIYVRDEDTGRVWLASSTESRTAFEMHKAEFHLRQEGISVHVNVAVAPVDDVEVRQIVLHNESGRPRRLTVTTAGRPVLLDARQAPTHPAFSSMFVQSEYLADLNGLLFFRRPQSSEERPAVVVHRLVSERRSVAFAGFETDRGAFYGRSGTRDAPLALASSDPLRGRAGLMLDPIMSLMASVELNAEGSVSLAFATTVGRSRAAAVELARKYGSLHAVRWVFRDASQESPRRLMRVKLSPEAVPDAQRLFSALHFADPAMRAGPEVLAAGKPCQRRLWGQGISGDLPILLVRVSDAQAPLIGDVLAAQRFLRSCSARFDLVLLDEQPSSYNDGSAGTLRATLTEHDANSWIHQRGGVYMVALDSLSAEQARDLEATAHVVLRTSRGSLAHQLAKASAVPLKLPRFEAALRDDSDLPVAQRPRPQLLFDNGIGGFSQDGREYVISLDPGQATPAPWCNVIANAELGCLVSESSLGVSWSLNSGENRLTPWRNDAVFDSPSEALYLRDEETAAVWTTTPLPAGRSSATRVRHGAGYTTYESDSHGLEQALTVFVPPDAGVKIVRLRVRNTLARHRRLTATYYAEWVLGSRREPQRPFIVSELDAEHACLLASCSWHAEFGSRVAFLAATNVAHNFTTDRTEFIGRRGDYARPEALERWGLTGRLDPGIDPCAALQVHVELAPGQETETCFLLGQADSRSAALALVERFRRPAEVDASWTALHAFWDAILGNIRVKTPEPAMDLMLNRWLLYQSLSARIFGRTGFYQSSGAIGYRDQLQDVLALIPAAPERTRAHLLEAARHQFEQGDVLHWWHPPSGRGVRTHCSDDLAWLPYVTAEYALATGDLAVLSETVPFLTGAPLSDYEDDRYAEYERSEASASLLEHCRRALKKSLTEGVHGLPLMGSGDWNDGMNRIGIEGRGESVWLGFFLCATMARFAELCARLGHHEEASDWRAKAKALRSRIEAVAWDGEWYVRAFHDDGSVVGAAKNRECRIDSIAQSWAVLSHGEGAEDEERARRAVNAADEQLVREADRLVLLFWPPFDSLLHDPGYIRAYPPGVRENGGQYTHAAVWLGWSHARLGDGARAERIFSLLNPVLHSRTRDQAERYRVEPYALAGDVYGAEPWTGRGGWTLYTGSASWLWRLGVEAILGLQRDRGRLRIDPCIPAAWPGFEAWITLEKCQVHVLVDNPDHVANGIALLTLDGASLSSNVIELPLNGAATHQLRVRLGKLHAGPNDASGRLFKRA